MISKRYLLEKEHPVVSELWELKATGDEPTLNFFVPPIGAPGIVLFISKPNQLVNRNLNIGFVKGQNIHPVNFTLIKDFHLLGIRLHPDGLRKILNCDTKMFTDNYIDLVRFPLLLSIHQLIESAKEINQNHITAILAFLHQHNRFSISKETTKFLQRTKESSSYNVSELINTTVIGIRSLQRSFIKEIGVSPKMYLRISRMNRIESGLSDNTDWISIVSDYNFSDQSHLIKEFKRLRQNNPNEFITKKLKLSSQLPIPTIVHLP